MSMLMTYFRFWNRNLHDLVSPCGPVSPTLMDIASITSLKPLGKTYALGLSEDQFERSEVGIDFSAKSYKGFIKKNAKDTEEVFDKEHIAFLLYWVSSHLLCTWALQIPMYCYNLAQALHFGEDICLSKFLLAFVYKVMDEVIEIMDALGKMKHIVGPLWIVQLRLNVM